MYNNAITINFPMGSGGHIAGRIISSCNNVSWYDHVQNGINPWDSFNIINDANFSRLHFNKRFRGALGKGVCDKTIPPVLDMAEKQGREYSQDEIETWKQRLYPNNFVYTLHSDLDRVKNFFNPAKHFVIIPEDIELLYTRWINSTCHYYVDPRNRNYLFKDLYTDKANEQGITFKECLVNDLTAQIEGYKQKTDDKDFIIKEVSQLYDKDFFVTLCEKFDLEFNEMAFRKTVKFSKDVSHL
jgi:hypothetical protein